VRYVTVEEFDALWDGKTVSYHDGVWYGFDSQDQTIIPFYGLNIVDGYVLFDDDSNPYLRVGNNPDGGAELLLDSDLPLVNYVKNPSFEVDTLNWSTISGTLTRNTSQFYIGTASAAVNASPGGGIQTTLKLAGKKGSTTYKRYWVSFWFKGNVANRSFNSRISGSGVLSFVNKSFISNGGWQKVSFTFVARENSNANLRVLVDASTIQTFYLDAVQVVGNEAPLDYFDGSTPDTEESTYAWGGTPNDSASLKFNKTPYYKALNLPNDATLLELDVDFTPYYDSLESGEISI